MGAHKSLFWGGCGQFVFIWVILGGFEYVLGDWEWLWVIVKIFLVIGAGWG